MKLLERLQNEPALVWTAISGILVLFGVNLTGEQTDALQSALTVGIPLLCGFVIRTFVLGPAKRDAAEELARNVVVTLPASSPAKQQAQKVLGRDGR